MQTIPQWEIFEASFTSGRSYENPFIQVTLQVEFTNGRNVYWVDGFYDGGATWRVRFAPMREGDWHFSTHSNDPALNGQTGAFTCDFPISRGGLGVHPQYSRYFCRADGDPEWVVNDGWYPHPLFGFTLPYEGLDFPQPSEQDMYDYLKVLGDHRVNMTIEVDQLYARQSAMTDPTFNWPWEAVDAAENRIDKDRFNLLYYRRMERTLAYAKQQGVFYGVELLFDNSVFRPREWSAHPLNRKNGGWLDSNEKQTGWGVIFDLNNREHIEYIARYLRYTVARLAAYWNVFWALGAESGNLAQVPGDEMDARIIAAWYGHWGDFVARRDIYGRLQAIGDTGEQEALIHHPRNQFIITQEHTSMENIEVFCQATNDFGERFWPYGRPTVIGEQDRHNLDHCDTERKGYWVAFASGFYMGRVDRHFGVAEKGILVESRLFGYDGPPPIYADLRRMSEFVASSGIPYWRMEPSDACLRGATGPVYCLAEPNEAYMLYFAAGGSAGLSLPACEGLWYNPRTGEQETFTAEAGEHRFHAPDQEDWVLYLHARPARP